MNYTIRLMEDRDQENVLKIYQQILNEEHVVVTAPLESWEDWTSAYLDHSRYVMENENDQLIGWATLSSTSPTPCFAGVAETNIYVEKTYREKGLGTMLLKKLVVDSSEHGIWTLQSQILETNQASVALHKRLGFRTVGIRYNLAKIGENWRNITLMERNSEQ